MLVDQVIAGGILPRLDRLLEGTGDRDHRHLAFKVSPNGGLAAAQHLQRAAGRHVDHARIDRSKLGQPGHVAQPAIGVAGLSNSCCRPPTGSVKLPDKSSSIPAVAPRPADRRAPAKPIGQQCIRPAIRRSQHAAAMRQPTGGFLQEQAFLGQGRLQPPPARLRSSRS